MAEVHYRVVEHDGGWTYQVDGVFAETYRTKDMAFAAAQKAAAEQRLRADPAEIEYEDKTGKWRREHSEGDVPPKTDVD